MGQCAELGDPTALSILQEAGAELGQIALIALERLGIGREETFPLAAVGGVFKAGEPLIGSYQQTILREFPQVRFVRPQHEPVVGAALLAWRQAGLDLTPRRLATLEAQLEGIS